MKFKLFLWIVRWLGSDIIDHRTGEKLGHALLIPWKGQIFVIGHTGRQFVPMFRPATKVTWKRDLVFTAHPSPDYPNERGS